MGGQKAALELARGMSMDSDSKAGSRNSLKFAMETIKEDKLFLIYKKLLHE